MRWGGRGAEEGRGDGEGKGDKGEWRTHTLSFAFTLGEA